MYLKSTEILFYGWWLTCQMETAKNPIVLSTKREHWISSRGKRPNLEGWGFFIKMCRTLVLNCPRNNSWPLLLNWYSFWNTGNILKPWDPLMVSGWEKHHEGKLCVISVPSTEKNPQPYQINLVFFLDKVRIMIKKDNCADKNHMNIDKIIASV